MRSCLHFSFPAENNLRTLRLAPLSSRGTMRYFGLPLITGDSLSRQHRWWNAESSDAIRIYDCGNGSLWLPLHVSGELFESLPNSFACWEAARLGRQSWALFLWQQSAMLSLRPAKKEFAGKCTPVCCAFDFRTPSRTRKVLTFKVG